MRLQTRTAALLVTGALLLGTTPGIADPLHLYAAGSLIPAMTTLLAQSGLAAEDVAPPVFGPSGALRQRIEHGEAADILASADIQQPRLLARERGGRPVLVFARNRMCALARQKLGVTPDNLLERMLDPQMRLATSTPGSDPAGDYAWAVFARAEALHPGAQAVLQAKALMLMGAADSKPLVAGHGPVAGVFLADRADIMLSYCSGSAEVLQDAPDLVSVTLPDALTVGPTYGMVMLSDNPLANRFATFVMSEAGQAILARSGFIAVAQANDTPAPSPMPAAGPVTARPPAPVTVMHGTAAPAQLTETELAALPAIQINVAFGTEHGPQQASFEGPLLYNVLVHIGAVDAAKPMGQVRQAVTVTGRDGYTAVLALGEIAPDFEGKQVILAERMNGQPLGPEHLRMVVPGDKRGGRSVRDVVRLAVN